MNVKVERTLLVVLNLFFAVITVLLFVPHTPVLSLFTLYLPVVFTLQSLQKSAIAFMMTIFTTLLGVFTMSQLGKEEALAIPFLILTLWGSVSLLHIFQEKISARDQKSWEEKQETEKQMEHFVKEIRFYETQRVELGKRAEKRQQLVFVARELGSSLDPTEIQQKLLETTRSIFAGRKVQLSFGTHADAVDNFVIQKAQPLLIPTQNFKGNPLIASPIMTQGAVAGVLRVGSDGGTEFSREDLRFLDILSSLASLALENCTLFHKVQETALRDNLTGLWTHRAFSDVLDASLLEASRYGQSLSIILTDVDHFKSVNDTHGHQAGDQILQGFAHILAQNVRDVDVVSRYGGEEFTVLLLQTAHADAAGVAEKIRRNLEAQEFDVGRKTISVTASFGIATFPQDATSSQQLMRVADQRLYAAKKAGRNRVQGRMAA